MRGAIGFDLLKGLLVVQHVVGVIAVRRCCQFPVVRQRRLELPLFVGVELVDLMASGLRRELDTLLLHLLHETSAGPFRQGHGDLFCLRIKLLGVLLPLTQRILS